MIDCLTSQSDKWRVSCSVPSTSITEVPLHMMWVLVQMHDSAIFSPSNVTATVYITFASIYCILQIPCKITCKKPTKLLTEHIQVSARTSQRCVSFKRFMSWWVTSTAMIDQLLTITCKSMLKRLGLQRAFRSSKLVLWGCVGHVQHFLEVV